MWLNICDARLKDLCLLGSVELWDEDVESPTSEARLFRRGLNGAKIFSCDF